MAFQFDWKQPPLMSIDTRWSKIPQIVRSYREAAQLTIEAKARLQTAVTRLVSLEVPVRRGAAVATQIAAVSPAAPNYQETLAALDAERVSVSAYAEAATDVYLAADNLRLAEQAEDEALLAATGGQPLSGEALEYVRSLLDI